MRLTGPRRPPVQPEERKKKVICNFDYKNTRFHPPSVTYCITITSFLAGTVERDILFCQLCQVCLQRRDRSQLFDPVFMTEYKSFEVLSVYKMKNGSGLIYLK